MAEIEHNAWRDAEALVVHAVGARDRVVHVEPDALASAAKTSTTTWN